MLGLAAGAASAMGDLGSGTSGGASETGAWSSSAFVAADVSSSITMASASGTASGTGGAGLVASGVG